MSPDDRDEECESHHLKSRFHNSLELVYDFLTLGESMKQITHAFLLTLTVQWLSSCIVSPIAPPLPPGEEGEGEGPGEGEGEGPGEGEGEDPGEGEGEEGEGDGGEGEGEPPEDCGLACVGSSGLLRLTRVQYAQSVRQILGTVTVNANGLPEDVNFHRSFVSNDIDMGAEDAEKLLSSAETIAAQVNVVTLTGCEAAACVNAAIQELGYLFHRTPLTAEETTAFRAIYNAEANHATGLRSVLISMLTSPSFLYVPFIGVETEPGVFRLSGRTLATRLSLFLWQRTPDRDLLDRAAEGALDTTEGIEAEATRMLLDPRADQMIQTFHRQWLDANALTTMGFSHPENSDFNAALARSMSGEINRFVVDVFRNQGGSLSTLLSGQYSFVDPSLAAFYGVPAVTGWTRVDNIPHRRGLLLQAGSIAANSSESWAHAVPRGLFVRRALLCQDLPDPGEVDRSPPPLAEVHSDREALERTTIEGGGSCSACHTVINPPGYALEQFSPTGKFRAIGPSYHPDADPADVAALDASGVLGEVPGYESDADGAFTNAEELIGALASSRDVARCMARQWTRFALGRMERPSADEPSALLAFQEFDAADRDIRKLIVAITTTPSFLHRRADP